VQRGENDARDALLNLEFQLALSRPCGNFRLLALIEAQHQVADRYVRIPPISNRDTAASRTHRGLHAEPSR
jgi:hypothetical protein